MPRRPMPVADTEHNPQNAMDDRDEIARFYDRCSDLMRELLDALADMPDVPHIFPTVEDRLGWPRRRIASVLGVVGHLRITQFQDRRPYRMRDERQASSGRWEIWCDPVQAESIHAARDLK